MPAPTIQKYQISQKCVRLSAWATGRNCGQHRSKNQSVSGKMRGPFYLPGKERDRETDHQAKFAFRFQCDARTKKQIWEWSNGSFDVKNNNDGMHLTMRFLFSCLCPEAYEHGNHSLISFFHCIPNAPGGGPFALELSIQLSPLCEHRNDLELPAREKPLSCLLNQVIACSGLPLCIGRPLATRVILRKTAKERPIGYELWMCLIVHGRYGMKYDGLNLAKIPFVWSYHMRWQKNDGKGNRLH